MSKITRCDIYIFVPKFLMEWIYEYRCIVQMNVLGLRTARSYACREYKLNSWKQEVIHVFGETVHITLILRSEFKYATFYPSWQENKEKLFSD